MNEGKFGWVGESLGSKAYKEETDFRLDRSRGERCTRAFVKHFDKGLKKEKNILLEKKEKG